MRPHAPADIKPFFVTHGIDAVEQAAQSLREPVRRRVMLMRHGPLQEGELALTDGSITLMLRDNIEIMTAAVRLCAERQNERDGSFSPSSLSSEKIYKSVNY